MLGKSLVGLLRILLFAVAFLIVAIFSIRMTDWSGNIRGILFAGEDYSSILYLLAFTFAIGYILRWLLKKEYRAQFVRGRKR